MSHPKLYYFGKQLKLEKTGITNDCVDSYYRKVTKNDLTKTWLYHSFWLAS